MYLLPRAAKRYIIAIWIVAAMVFGVASLSLPFSNQEYLIWFPVWVGLFVVADYFEVEFEVHEGDEILMTVYEALLMFWVPVMGLSALPIIVIGSLLTDVLHRRQWFRSLFNAAERVITFSLLVGLYGLFNFTNRLPYSGPVGLLALVCVMAAYYSSNTILVSAVLAFKTGTSFWKVVSAAYARVHWVHFLTLPLGALLAILWYVDRWLMVIGFVLLLMAHRAFRALAASQSSRARASALALQLEQLQSITTATVSSLQPTSVASTLSRRLAELLQARASWVVLFGQPVRQTALHGASPAWLEASTEYLATLQPHEIAQINPADLMPAVETPIAGTLLSIPMAVEQRILGVICLEFEGDAQLDDATQRVLTAFATQAALVMEHAEIFSALQRQQDELVRSSKLAALGTFSAGIAHEFNNVLAGILGHAQLGRFSDDAAEMAESFRVIEEACVRARKITSGLLTFARRRAPQRRLSRVQEAIETAQLLIERDLLKHNIELECRIEAVEPTVCDQDQLAQVVLNLLTNARDAISETDRPGRIVVSLGMEDGWIALRVADNGCGIDEELQYQLFQPFVTTKIGHSASGSGTGLGLAICYGIIESHKGTIDVTSSRGVGTTVTIRLPVVDGEQPEASPGLVSQLSTRLRILVVDDEPQVLRSVTMLLQRRGHDVHSAPGAVTALHMCQERRYDLVITDLMMPGMDGMRLYEQLRLHDPYIQVVVMTGQPTAAQVELLTQAGVAVLQKPFTIEELDMAIRDQPSHRFAA